MIDTHMPGPDESNNSQTSRQLTERLLMPVLQRAFAQASAGRLVMRCPGGTDYVLGRNISREPDALIQLNRMRAVRRLLTGGHLGFCEAYMDGDWESPDLNAIFDFILTNRDALRATSKGSGIYRGFHNLVHRLRNNTRRQAKRNISAHYDLGNAFYSLWLDPGMTYSSALFENADYSLEDAQYAKYRQLCEHIGLEQGGSVLEIGCGWGGFAEFAGREYGARVTGITISQEQFDYATERMKLSQLANQNDIVLVDYRDVGGQFDHIASIEMFEAVGEDHWPDYFRVVHDRLKPGGTAGLQIICVEDERFRSYRKSVDFVQRYIFPGGMLASPKVVYEQARAAGLEFVRDTFFGSSYARTLRIWSERFLSAWPQIEQMGFDERFRRTWLLYLEACESWFANGATDVGLFTFRRPL